MSTIGFACESERCDFAIVVEFPPEDAQVVDALIGYRSEWAESAYTCPKCKETMGCGGDTAPLRAVRLTKEEAFRAFLGMGLPEETQLTPELIKSLEGAVLTSFDVEEVRGSPWVVVERIHLSTGQTLHLGSSSRGAVIHKVEVKK